MDAGARGAERHLEGNPGEPRGGGPVHRLETHGFGLSPSQWFSAAAVLTAVGMLIRRRSVGIAGQGVAVDSN